MSLLKSALSFLTNQAVHFITHNTICSFFGVRRKGGVGGVGWREFTSIIPCNEWIQDSIQIKETVTFLCLSSPANIGGSNFLLKAKMSMCFIFWVWMTNFDLIYLKISRKGPNFEIFLYIKPFAQLWNNGLDLSIHNTVRLGWVNVNMQSTCCSEARPNRKLKILII